MKKPDIKELLEVGAHFGHLTRKWNPHMAPYIYGSKNKIHIINLQKTAAKIEEAQKFLKNLASTGRQILFVSTKKQAKDILAEKAKSVGMPYIAERWPGGMLTNFVTIRKAVKKMAHIDKMKKDGTYDTLSKKEKLHLDRLRAKLEKNLGSIADMTRLPAALIVVDVNKEHVAVKEANKLGIPIVGIVDTNADPRPVTFPIPANDDASKSIELILEYLTDAIREGLEERKLKRMKADEEAQVAGEQNAEQAE
ncbi:MAG: 30S ribosomal protein S2 [Chlorobi bacterium]|nr:30S ribosomal protein S2 [Chlorobiota bacterium]